METGVAVVILLEIIGVLACIYGFLHEDKLVRIEHAFVMAVIWTLWEKAVQKDRRPLPEPPEVVGRNDDV